MWRNIVPQVIYQVLVMCVLMFCGQLIFFEKSFNIITEPDTPNAKGIIDDQFKNDDNENDNSITNRMRLNTMCFHTFMLMNMINLINSRDVSDDHLRIFKTFLNNKLFLITFAMEITVQVCMVEFGSTTPILGTNGLTIGMNITAWVLALLTIPLHVAVVKYVPASHFAKCL